MEKKTQLPPIWRSWPQGTGFTVHFLMCYVSALGDRHLQLHRTRVLQLFYSSHFTESSMESWGWLDPCFYNFISPLTIQLCCYTLTLTLLIWNKLNCFCFNTDRWILYLEIELSSVFVWFFATLQHKVHFSNGPICSNTICSHSASYKDEYMHHIWSLICRSRHRF